MYSSGNVNVRNSVHLFESPCTLKIMCVWPQFSGMRHTILSPVRRYSIFLHSHKRHDFGAKKVTEHKMGVLIFGTTFVCKTPHSKKTSARYQKGTYIIR